jgi:hypothetical protein
LHEIAHYKGAQGASIARSDVEILCTNIRR